MAELEGNGGACSGGKGSLKEGVWPVSCSIQNHSSHQGAREPWGGRDVVDTTNTNIDSAQTVPAAGTEPGRYCYSAGGEKAAQIQSNVGMGPRPRTRRADS